MSIFKKVLSLAVRLILVCGAMAFSYLTGWMVFGQSASSLSPEELSWSSTALFLVSAINALVLSFPILRSRWYGLKLTGAILLVQFGVETFMTQVETLYFNRSLQVDAAGMTDIVVAGAIRAIVFAPLAVITLGKMRKPQEPGGEKKSGNIRQWILRMAGLAVIYPFVYFLCGYFIAWQWEATRLFYTGSAAILPFFTHFEGLFTVDRVIIPFQLARGAGWALLALLIISMMEARRWEAALAVALVFSGLLCSGIGLFPNPYMPFPVRMSHFFELLISMLVFGGFAGWLLHPLRQSGDRIT